MAALKSISSFSRRFLALELAAGREIRSHCDIDVLFLRRDHLDVRQFLADWDCWAADPPGTLRQWPPDRELGSHVHDIWCRKTPDDDWRLQLMLDEANGEDWVSRRDSTIRGSLRSITRTTADGVRYLAPHVQLYYKAKNLREKDEIDFNAVIDSGVSMDVEWLREAISHSHGDGHPWLKSLRG